MTNNNGHLDKAICALAPSYFPNLDYFWQLVQCRALLLTDHYQFVRRSPATISAPLQTSQPALTIPVRHTDKPLPVYKKRIDTSSNWSRKHIQTIRHIFHHAPYSYIYQPQLEELLLKEETLLAELLINLLKKILQWLHIEIPVLRASEFPDGLSNEQLILAAARQTGSHGFFAAEDVWQRGAVSPTVLEKAGIRSATFAPLAEYHILQSNRELSILYFLMHYGPEAGYMLRQYLTAAQPEE